MPFFSIIIPTYNRAAFLPKAIESVLSQTFSDWELIVVDDGSVDNTKEVVEKYKDDSIRYIYQENAERSVARNNGISKARGAYICFLDSDDYYLPEHLNTFYEFILQKDKPKGFFFMNVTTENKGERKLFKLPYDNNTSFAFFFKNLITPNMVCIHRDIFYDHLFIEDYKKAYWEDTHLWIRIALSNPYYYLDKYTCVQVEHSNRSVNTIEKKQLSMRYKDHLDMVKHLFEYNNQDLMKCLNKNFYREYINNRHCMFLYMSRTNKYLLLSLKIWCNAWKNKPSIYLVNEFKNIMMNCLYLKKR